jgi:hypothetical protein
LAVGVGAVLGALGIVGADTLVGTVQVEVNRAIENTQVETAALEEKIESQGRRIDTLSGEVAQNRAARHADEDAGLAAIAEDASFEAISDAIRDAERRQAISSLFRVPATANTGGMHLRVQNGQLGDRAVGSTPVIFLTPWFADDREVPMVIWKSGQDAVEIFGELDQNIESAHLSPDDLLDSAVFIKNLTESISLANAALRGHAKHLEDPLIERLTDEWVLTEAGLEALSSDFILPIAAFPSHLQYMNAISGGETPAVDAPLPKGVDPEMWELLVEIARRTFQGFGRLASTRR